MPKPEIDITKYLPKASVKSGANQVETPKEIDITKYLPKASVKPEANQVETPKVSTESGKNVQDILMKSIPKEPVKLPVSQTNDINKPTTKETIPSLEQQFALPKDMVAKTSSITADIINIDIGKKEAEIAAYNSKLDKIATPIYDSIKNIQGDNALTGDARQKAKDRLVKLKREFAWMTDKPDFSGEFTNVSKLEKYQKDREIKELEAVVKKSNIRQLARNILSDNKYDNMSAFDKQNVVNIITQNDLKDRKIAVANEYINRLSKEQNVRTRDKVISDYKNGISIDNIPEITVDAKGNPAFTKDYLTNISLIETEAIDKANTEVIQDSDIKTGFDYIVGATIDKTIPGKIAEAITDFPLVDLYGYTPTETQKLASDIFATTADFAMLAPVSAGGSMLAKAVTQRLVANRIGINLIKNTAVRLNELGFSSQLSNKLATEQVLSKYGEIASRMGSSAASLGIYGTTQAELGTYLKKGTLEWTDHAFAMKQGLIDATIGSALGLWGSKMSSIQRNIDAYTTGKLKRIGSVAGVKVADFVGENAIFVGLGAGLRGKDITYNSLVHSFTFLAGMRLAHLPKTLIKSPKDLFVPDSDPYKVEFTKDDLRLLKDFGDTSPEILRNIRNADGAKLRKLAMDEDIPLLTKEKILWGAAGVRYKDGYLDYNMDNVDLKENRISVKNADGVLIDVKTFDSVDKARKAAMYMQSMVNDRKNIEKLYKLPLEVQTDINNKFTEEEILDFNTALNALPEYRTSKEKVLINKIFGEVNKAAEKIEKKKEMGNKVAEKNITPEQKKAEEAKVKEKEKQKKLVQEERFNEIYDKTVEGVNMTDKVAREKYFEKLAPELENAVNKGEITQDQFDKIIDVAQKEPGGVAARKEVVKPVENVQTVVEPKKEVNVPKMTFEEKRAAKKELASQAFADLTNLVATKTGAKKSLLPEEKVDVLKNLVYIADSIQMEARAKGKELIDHLKSVLREKGLTFLLKDVDEYKDIITEKLQLRREGINPKDYATPEEYNNAVAEKSEIPKEIALVYSTEGTPRYSVALRDKLKSRFKELTGRALTKKSADEALEMPEERQARIERAAELKADMAYQRISERILRPTEEQTERDLTDIANDIYARTGKKGAELIIDLKNEMEARGIRGSEKLINKHADAVLKNVEDFSKKHQKALNKEIVSKLKPTKDIDNSLKSWKKGFSTGVRKGVKEGSKEAKEFMNEARQSLLDNLRGQIKSGNLTQRDFGKIETLLGRVDSKNIDNFIDKAGEIIETTKRNGYRNDIDKILKRFKPSLRTGKPEQRKISTEAQEFINISDILYNNKVDNAAKEINKLKIELQGKISDSRREMVEAQIKALEFVGNRDMAMDEIQGIVEKVMREEADAIEKGIDYEMSSKDLTTIEMLNMVGSKNLDSNQLKGIKNTLDSVIENGRSVEQNRKFADDMIKKEKVSKSFFALTGGKKKLKEADEIAKKKAFEEILRDLENYHQRDQSFATMMEYLSRYEREDASGKKVDPFTGGMHVLSDMIFDARDMKGRDVRLMVAYVADNAERIFGVEGKELSKKLKENSKEQEFELPIFNEKTGKYENRIKKYSKSEAYPLWQKWQDPTLRDTFTKKGWDGNTIKALERFITDGGKDMTTLNWAKWQLEEFYPNYHNKINVPYKNKFGTDLPFSAVYSPTFRERKGVDAKDILDDDVAFVASAINGHLKSRVKNTRWFAKANGDKVMLSYINKMEHFIHFNEVVKSLNQVFKDDNIREAIKQFHGGAKALKIIDSHIQDISKDKTTGDRIDWLDKRRRDYVRAKIGINPVITIKQLTSIPAYMNGLKTRHIPAFYKNMGVFFLNPLENAKFISEMNYIKNRYSVSGFNRELAEISKSIDLKRLATGSFKDQLMFMAKLGDKGAIVLGGWAFYKTKFDYYKKQDKSDEVAAKLAEKDFVKQTRLTQQSGNIEDLSYFQRSSIGKILTLFQNSPMQYRRLEFAAIQNFINKRGSRIDNVKNFAIFHFILPGLFQAASKGFTSLWDEDMKRTLALGSFAYLFIAGDIAEGIADYALKKENFDYGNFISDIPNEIIDAAKESIDFIKNNDITLDDIMKTIEKDGSAIGDFTGYPIGMAARVSGGIYDYSVGKTNDPRRLIGYSPWMLDARDVKSTAPYVRKNDNLKDYLEDMKDLRGAKFESKKTQLIKDYKIYKKYGYDDANVNYLYSPKNNNSDKVDYLIGLTKEMTPEEFNKLANGYTRKFRYGRNKINNVISLALAKKFNETREDKRYRIRVNRKRSE